LLVKKFLSIATVVGYNWFSGFGCLQFIATVLYIPLVRL